MKKHKQFSIITNPRLYDIVSGLLWNLEIEGINETDLGLVVYANEESPATVQQIEELLENLKKENIIELYNIEESEIDEINWNEEWEKNIDVIKVSDKLIIKPTFKDYTPNENETVIIIDPKMSFGTGEHETTKLVLNYIEEVDLKEKKVLDIGSGTAVLAIAAAKLGAAKVMAVDNDEWCYINGLENVERNSATHQVEVICGEIKDVKDKGFDVILANINKNILIELADDISKLINKNGTLILSGLLEEDESMIKSVFKQKGFLFINKKVMNEWIALKFEMRL